MKETPHWSERLKDLVETAAILIGGIWALFTFGVEKRPALALRRRATSSLEWAATRNPHYSKVMFSATLENTGTTVFNVKTAHLEAWICPDVTPASAEPAQYLDVQLFKAQGRKFLDTTFSDRGKALADYLGTPYIGRYNKGAVWNENFEFLLQKDTNKVVLFYLTFFEAKHPDEPYEWTYQWDYIGGAGKATVKAGSHEKPSDDEE